VANRVRRLIFIICHCITDKLVNLAEVLQAKMEDKSGGELSELYEEMLFNINWVQNIASMLLNFDDPEMSGQAHAAPQVGQ
jgi:hypothetical protein